MTEFDLGLPENRLLCLRAFLTVLSTNYANDSSERQETVPTPVFPIPSPGILLSELFKRGPLIKEEKQLLRSNIQTRNKAPVGGVRVGRHYAGQWPAPRAPSRRPGPRSAASGPTKETTKRGRNLRRQTLGMLGSGEHT